MFKHFLLGLLFVCGNSLVGDEKSAAYIKDIYAKIDKGLSNTECVRLAHELDSKIFIAKKEFVFSSVMGIISAIAGLGTGGVLLAMGVYKGNGNYVFGSVVSVSGGIVGAKYFADQIEEPGSDAYQLTALKEQLLARCSEKNKK